MAIDPLSPVRQKSPRVHALLEELSSAAKAYVTAKQEYDVALVTFEAAQERFAKVKEMASEGLYGRDWLEWGRDHTDVAYAGAQMGEAINRALEHFAFAAAQSVVEGKVKEYSPVMYIDAIIRVLEEGGFEFKSSAPRREVNAALINLSTVEKITANFYRTKDYQDILSLLQPTQPEVSSTK